MATHSLALSFSFLSDNKYISGLGFNLFTNFAFPIKLKSLLLIEFLKEYKIAFILCEDVDETNAILILFFLHIEIKF